MKSAASFIATAQLVLVFVIIGAVAFGVVWFWKNRDKFNPASDKNLVNQGASAIVKGITGGAASGGEDSIGGVAARVREWISGDDRKIRDMLRGGRPSTPASVDPFGGNSNMPGDVVPFNPYSINPRDRT